MRLGRFPNNEAYLYFTLSVRHFVTLQDKFFFVNIPFTNEHKVINHLVHWCAGHDTKDLKITLSFCTSMILFVLCYMDFIIPKFSFKLRKTEIYIL